jgi:hypothetical protein
MMDDFVERIENFRFLLEEAIALGNAGQAEAVTAQSDRIIAELGDPGRQRF